MLVFIWESRPNIASLQETQQLKFVLEASQLLDQHTGRNGQHSASGQPICNPCSNLYKIDFCLPCYSCSQGMERLTYTSDALIIGILSYGSLYSHFAAVHILVPMCMKNFDFNILFWVPFPFHTLSCYFSAYPYHSPRPLKGNLPLFILLFSKTGIIR